MTARARQLDPHFLFDTLNAIAEWCREDPLVAERATLALADIAGAGFLRVHRRAVVNLAQVDRLRPLPTGGYLAVTRGGDEVPVSRQQARRLRQWLGI